MIRPLRNQISCWLQVPHSDISVFTAAILLHQFPLLWQLKYVSLGGFVSYQSYAYSDTYQETIPPYNNVLYDYVYSAISMGLKGSFHVFPYLNDKFQTEIDDSRMDAYLTAYAGVSLHSYRELTSTGYTGYDKLVPRYIAGPGAGFRYMFINRFGAFAEAGVGAVGFTTIGVVYKL